MNKRSRVSQEQREVLLQFMMGHEDLARGRVVGADAARRKNYLLQQLADALNAIGSGATKSPDKWWKCWQDWRSDTKAKAIKIKKYSAGTGGGPSPAPLTNLELTLVQFCGLEMVQGVQGVLDPLELTGQEVNHLDEPAPVTEEAPFASVASTSTATVSDEVTPSAAVPEEAERQAGSGHKTKHLKRSRGWTASPNILEADTQDLYEASVATKQAATNNSKCKDCEKYNSSDNRNEHFSQLLCEEFRYIQPCIRTSCFIKILKFLDEAKHNHCLEIDIINPQQ